MISKITIVGTGLAGLTAALTLAELNENVTLIGPVPDTSRDDRTTAILAPGIELLKSLDLWRDCKATAVALTTMELIDKGQSFVYDADEMGYSEFGFNITNLALKKTLTARLKKHQNVTWLETIVTDAAFDNQAWYLQLQNKKKITAKYIIAADGRHSMMRQAANIATDEKTDDQTALVTIVQADQPHYNTSTEWYRAGGPLTLVPMQDNKMAVVWCERDDDARMKTTLSLNEISKELSTITEYRFGNLTVLKPLQMWPITPMKAHQLVKNNVILIGEAGHVLPPIGAQGYNTSLHDITALCDSIAKAHYLGLDPYDATSLRSYEQTRLKDVGTRYRGFTTLNMIIRTQNPVLETLRRIGLKTFDRPSFLRRKLMRFGMGDTTKGNAA